MPFKEKTFKVKDFVWAKVAGYPYWPAVVMKPNPLSECKSKKESYWIYFFGANNYAWVNVKFVKPYEENKKKLLDRCSENISVANKELISNKKKLASDPNYEIVVAPFILKEKKTRAKRSRSRASSAASIRSRSSSVRSRASSVGSTKSGKVRSVCLDLPSPKRLRRVAGDDGFPKISTKHVDLSIATIGIIVCNIYGEAAARNLINCGHNVVCWSPSKLVCKRLVLHSQSKNQYFKVYGSARHVAEESSVIFSFMSTEKELSSIYTELGLNDSNNNLMSGKAYIEMSQIVKLDDIFETMEKMEKKDARYMTAMIQGSRQEFMERDAVLIVGGDVEEVMREFKSCFFALAKESRYIGLFNKTIKIHVSQKSIKGMMLASLMEALAASHLKNQNLELFARYLKKMDFYTPYLGNNVDSVLNKRFNTMQEDYNTTQACLKNSIATSNKWCLSMTHTARANEIFKNARDSGLDGKDVSSLYLSLG